MKILLLAGEESGLLYANRLKALLGAHEVRGYGDYGFRTADLAVMGFWAVLKKLFFFLRVKRTMTRAIDAWRPDVVCTIDYPGMNLKLAAYAKAKGIRAVHVVCPQVWAWRAGRIPKIEAALDRLCCFFPFEPSLFTPGFATFVGHPLAEEFGAVAATGATRRADGAGARLVALLPGSRLGEIERCLPTMLAATRQLKDVELVIPAANEGARRAIDAILARRAAVGPTVTVQSGGARALLLRADCAVVASGTATLEAALARCPTVLVYRVGRILAAFLRHVIKGVRHVGLINIVWEKSGAAGAAPMPELLQEAFTAEAVAAILTRWLGDARARAEAVAALDGAVQLLNAGSGALEKIVAELLA